MPHVTFIHGIANKPPVEKLHETWLRELSIGGIDLLGQGVTSELVYWADILYDQPLASLCANAESLVEPPVEDIVVMMDAETSEERAFIQGLSTKLDLVSGDGVTEGPLNSTLERVPLPWPVKKRILRAFVRDAHHYLFDVEHQPRPGARYRVQTEIRRRTLEAFQNAPDSGPHVVVAHSLGSVIAYDVLQRVDDCPSIDALLTIGSPLGIDEIQDRLRPEWTRTDGYPFQAVRGRWINVYDPLDLICCLDPRLANDYRRNGLTVIEDVSVTNPGSWRHSFEKYAQQSVLTAHLADLLTN